MNKPLSRIRNLQALRIYAAIPVILYHTHFTLPGLRPIGLFGVHLFFLMSGYIMAGICDNDTTAFMRRRLIRIIPSIGRSLFILLHRHCLEVSPPDGRYPSASLRIVQESLLSAFREK